MGLQSSDILFRAKYPKIIFSLLELLINEIHLIQQMVFP
jgi:hypothetical protein